MIDEASRKTPVAVFLYNRPNHAKLALESLSRCRRLDECSVEIYCDGPKNPEALEQVTTVRQVAREWSSRLDAKVIERETNIGLARSIVTAVTELCDRHGRAIVIEDDLLLSPSFLDYMLLALDKYACESNVYQVSGYMYQVRHSSKHDAFFLPLTTTWGWATWARAWKVFDWDATDAQHLLRDPEVRRRFNLDNAYPYAEMLEKKLDGHNDSWGILFWWAVFKAGGLVLHPKKSLVWNSGFDETGTHGGDRTWSNQALSDIADNESTTSFLLPEEIVTDQAAFQKIISFLRLEQSEGNLFTRIRRRILQRRGQKERHRLITNNAR